MKGFLDRLSICAQPALALLAGSFIASSFIGVVHAGEPWLAPGDTQVRHDIMMLVDDGIIELPMSGWPIPVSDLAHALSSSTAGGPAADRSTDSKATSGLKTLSMAQSAALARLRRIASPGDLTLGFEVAGAGRPTELRT